MKIYNEDVMSALRQVRGLSSDNTSDNVDIMSMSKPSAFHQYCIWNGLIGNWSEYLLQAVDSIFDTSVYGGNDG